MTINLLTTAQAAARLGVKAQTVYAYVSRGQLTRTLAEDGRRSLFDPREVERLAQRGRPRAAGGPGGPGAADGSGARGGRIQVSIATSVAGIVDGRLYYRGREATGLAGKLPFERVAELLWGTELDAQGAQTAQAVQAAQVPVFELPAAALRPVRAACAGLPPGAPMAERFAVACGALAASSPLRVDLRPAQVRMHARQLLRAFVQVLPPQPAARAETAAVRDRRLARALWPRLSAQPATRARVDLLDAALVLLADHGLATSTLAARVAASTRADPHGVVLSALGAVSGPLHGKAAMGVHRLLLEAQAAPSPGHAVAASLAPGAHMVGFGHPVYRDGDPRALRLLALLRPVAKRGQLRVIAEVRRACEGRVSGWGGETAGEEAGNGTGAAINVDFALGALAYVGGMPLGATEAVFALARTAGWIAHALEEYQERPLRYRARAVYEGGVP